MIDQRQCRARLGTRACEIERMLKARRATGFSARRRITGPRPEPTRSASHPDSQYGAQRLRDVVADFVIVDPLIDNAQRPAGTRRAASSVNGRGLGTRAFVNHSGSVGFGVGLVAVATAATRPAASACRDATARAARRACRRSPRRAPTSSRTITRCATARITARSCG